MGWFEHDTKDKAQTAAKPARSAPEPRPAASTAVAPARGGSTLGERVHIIGTITSDEDVTILGKVDGTIHARQTLRVSKEAELKAVIHGRNVLLEGSVTGDVHGAETVVLGPTASLTGNIATPSLEIKEGAFFKGSIEMQGPAQDKPAVKPPAEASKAALAARAAAGKPKQAASASDSSPVAAAKDASKQPLPASSGNGA